jgi:hypothetical protein
MSDAESASRLVQNVRLPLGKIKPRRAEYTKVLTKRRRDQYEAK